MDSGSFRRTANRRDYTIVPGHETVLDILSTNNISVCGIGKINDIFSGRGIDRKIHTTSNQDGLYQVINILEDKKYRFIFANLVD
ncbi:phosphopentomutase, partial [Corynebacterium amycolatum]|nr:phosphopentomutase [Corynebacterium amycolatum]